MNIKERNLLRGNIKEYYKLLFPSVKVNEKDLLKCPLNCSQDLTAHFVHNQLKCYNPACPGAGDIFNMAKTLKPNLKDLTDSDIAEIIKYKLNIRFIDDTEDLIKRYAEAGFALIPLNPNSKIPLKGTTEWQNTEYKNPVVWKDWIDRGYNLGLNLGKVSNIVAVDIDDEPTYEKMKSLLGETLTQKTGKGWHFLYNYDPDFSKTLNKVLRDAGYEMELRTDKSYVVIAPSIAYEGDNRQWNQSKIIDMPEELKAFFITYYKTEVKTTSPDEEIQQAINEEIVPLTDLSHKRNDTFVKLGGILRKKLNVNQTEYVLNIISNNLIDKPIEQRELRAILNQIKKYQTYDKKELAKQVLERLEIIGDGSAFQLAKTLNYEQKDIEDVIKYLLDEEKIISLGKNRYKRLKRVEWKEDYNEESGKPIDFEVPYFSKYSFFDWQNMIIVGGITGSGKTFLTGNIIRQLVNQKVKPYLINTESGSKIGKVCNKLGLKTGDFYITTVKNAVQIELPDNAICIIDWLQITDSDFSKIANIYEHLHNQLKKHNSFLIVMSQLKKDGRWFSENLHDWYSAFTVRYLYGNNGTDNVNTYFQTDKIRDSKTGLQYFTIPTTYNPETSEIILK